MLGRDWQDAEALVIASEQYTASGGDAAGMNSSVHMVLEVQPSGAEPFRTSLKVNQLGFNLKNRRFAAPNVGERIPVQFDPKSHKVKVVIDEAHDARTVKKGQDDAWQAMVDAPVGSGPATPALPDDLGELLTKQLGLQGGNVHVNVETVDVPPQGWPTGPANPLDQIEQLGKLKEQGLLTEDEFAAQKARILGGG